MEQVVNFPTRKQNTLDLLITNRPSFIKKCIPVPGFGDHDSAILSDLICHPQATKPFKRKIHNWKRANLEELRKNVKEQMVKFVRGNTINASTIKQLQEKFVPNRMSSSLYSQPWFNRECKKHVRRKKRLYNKARKTGLDVDWFRFKDAAARSRKTCKKAYNNFISSSVASNNKSDSKRFFSFIKSKRNENVGISPLRENSTMKIADKTKARIINHQFSSVFFN